jgi:hypothetical protein
MKKIHYQFLLFATAPFLLNAQSIHQQDDLTGNSVAKGESLTVEPWDVVIIEED